MPRICTVCTHEHRKEIDEALIAGKSIAGIARDNAVSDDALFRHKVEHLPATLAVAHKAEQMSQADELLGSLAGLVAEAHRIKDKAESAGDYKTALGGIRELVRIIDLQAEMRGEINRAPQVNLIQSPEFMQVQAVIVQALDAFPMAREAVLKALEAANAAS